ncbi:class I SAM-dependent methyltransferase [Aspergillus stella-maris]|uniref:class I SAM-dependent methyltransferase n=1 Tax=Aspergillus stella-maris TaxID=1810926 RepID=UPI003CCCC89C
MPSTRAQTRAQTRQAKSDYLLKAVETDENERLDIQHRMIQTMMGQQLLHPDIPTNFERVADVATGNGTWLYDLKKALRKSGKEIPGTKYHGFDISSTLFPKQDSPQKSSADVDFTAHDFYKPFPEEHLGKYDIVHARLLVLAIQLPDLKLAIENIMGLLKPGGYIQWEEYDFADQLARAPSCTMASTWDTILNWIAERGYSLTFTDSLTETLSSCGLEITERKQFSTKGLPFSEDHKLTLLYAFYTGVPKVCLKIRGKTDEEIETIVKRCLEEWEGGLLIDYYLSRVTARKPLDS